jgi:hypothetical protein
LEGEEEDDGDAVLTDVLGLETEEKPVEPVEPVEPVDAE